MKCNAKQQSYHFSHSTDVAGLMGINHGDDRFFNNIFSSDNNPNNNQVYTGLNAFNGFPLSQDRWYQDKKNPNDFASLKLPVYIESNLYYNKSLPFEREKNYIKDQKHKTDTSIEKIDEKLFLKIKVNKSYEKLYSKLITTDVLGSAFQSESPFESIDGSALIFDTDFSDSLRNLKSPKPGPFEFLRLGENKIEVFDLDTVKK